MNGSPVAAPKRTKYDRWEVEDAMQCLMRAKTIQADKVLMKHVKALAQERMSAVASIANKPLPK